MVGSESWVFILSVVVCLSGSQALAPTTPVGRSSRCLQAHAFGPTAPTPGRSTTFLQAAGDNNDDSSSSNPFSKFSFNPLQELSDMMSSMDDVIDDFMGKRMGNGEVFYGQRKYKPSGRENTTGDYNGMGLSDKTKIDVARQRRQDFWMQKLQRQEQDQE